METQSIIHNTFVIEKSYPAKPERVFAAFADPAKKRRWFVEGEHHTVESYEMDFREGGKEKSHSRFIKNVPVVGGLTCTNQTNYLDIVPNKRLVFASTMMIEESTFRQACVPLSYLPQRKGQTCCSLIRPRFSKAPTGRKCGKMAGRSCSPS